MKEIYKKWIQCGKHQSKAILTVEMSYLMPLILWVFLMIVYIVFYFHDKNILSGAAAETAVVAAQIQREPERTEDMEGFFYERLSGKLIFLSQVTVSVEQSDERVTVHASARKRNFAVSVEQKANVVKPEKKIRRKMILENLVEGE